MESKKLLVFSDTHGRITALKAVLNWAKNHVPPNDTICCTAFLGDGASDIGRAAEASGFYSNWKLVRGNNDYESIMPDSAVFDFAEYRFFMCHGHRQGLHGGTHGLIAAGRSNNADVVLFGHTHVPFYKNADGLLLINPGSVGSPRSRIGATFAVIECTSLRSVHDRKDTMAVSQPPSCADTLIKANFFGIDAQGKIEKVKL
ncbi:MAG: metallophosphoesterase [Treponema sp.]|jgi:putative phosphoesterase|nr:metallophosphoesterase [Treponema sp.]